MHMQTGRCAIALVVAGLAASSASGVIIYTEGPDLSNNQGAPTPFTLAPGINSIQGSVAGGTGGDQQDWVAVTIPAGFVLSSYVLASYVSTDQQGFTGFQIGSSFVGSALSAGSYTGFSHFGTNATNGSLPPANLVGQDLLPIMANPLADPGAQGFTPPLGAGTYTFLIQQTGSALTSYQFDFGVTQAPAPGVLALGALGAAGAMRRRRYL
jgi:MYXO-CTERM domain-containing protein